MTLAALLLLGILSHAQNAPTSSPAQAPEQASPSSPAIVPERQPQAGTSQAAPSKPSSTTTKKKTKKHHRKRAASSGCGTLPNPNSGTTAVASATAGNSDTQGSGTKPVTKDCPPPKIIVRHGGTTEPSIQLAAPNDQAARQRDAVNQLIGATEQNLKKVEGRQLNSNQQDTISQSRQFIAQSRAAIVAGDLERARTLAWKAQTLSEDLVKPPK